MDNNKKISLLMLWLTLLSVGYFVGATYTLNISTPSGTDDPREADDRMREIKNAFIERLDRDHSWNTSSTSVYDGDDVGKHDRLMFVEAADIGTGATGYPILGAETVIAPELTWKTEGDATLNITDAGTLNIVSADLLGTVANATYFTAVDNAGTGTVDLIQADANDVAVLPDNSQTATNAAPTSSTGIANKKFVDDNVGSANYTPTSYTGAQSVTFPNGLILKMGMENVNGNTADDVTYDVAFPTGFTWGFATIKSTVTNLNTPVYVFPKSGSEDTILQVVNGFGSALDIYWQAWGY